uniref:Uncharacterized protein n=1 Tax=Varanus komodoensis TaxID=61221 RepID=A0A8D2KWX3_VARKO
MPSLQGLGSQAPEGKEPESPQRGAGTTSLIRGGLLPACSSLGCLAAPSTAPNPAAPHMMSWALSWGIRGSSSFCLHCRNRSSTSRRGPLVATWSLSVQTSQPTNATRSWYNAGKKASQRKATM